MRSGQVAVAGCVVAALLPGATVLSGSAAGVRVADVAAAAFPGENGSIAFTSDAGGDEDVWVVAPDGAGARALTTASTAETEPAWSPDGTQLVFVREDGDGSSALFVVDRDGSGERRITADGAVDHDPAWSPDGRRIVFQSNRGEGTSQLWVVEAGGGDPELLVPEPDEGVVADPSWSPDGRQIAFASAVGEGGAFALYVTDVDDPDDPTRITNPESESHTDPDWSPDGTRIAYTVGGDGSSAIGVVRADGSGPTLLTEGERDARPSWSPDGRSLVFARTVTEGTSEVGRLWTMAADGSGEEQLTTGGGTEDDTQPSWGPVPPVTAIVVEPPTDARDVGDDATVEATATDRLGDPVAGADLALRITGAHPRTARLTTGATGRASYTWESTTAGTDTALVCADPDGDGTCDPADPADTAAVLWSVPAADEPRLAFTDDTDALFTLDVRVPTASGDPPYRQVRPLASFESPVSGFRAGPTHEGEAGGTPGAPPAFVSTRDDPAGEVYLARIRDQAPFRVTCDPGAETHPVAAPSGAVAYASDADGDWDVYVSLPPPPPPPGRVAPFGRSAVPAGAAGPAGPRAALATACADDWETLNLTDEPAGGPLFDDLWPTWTYSGSTSGAVRDGVAFSRAAAGELPDLYRVVGTGRVFGPPLALTATPDVAETQPAGMALVVTANTGCEPPCFPTETGRGWLAFTTTAIRSSGSIALLPPDDPTDVRYPPGVSPQASEPAWSSVENPSHLAVTTTRDDPYGDIAIATVAAPEPVGTPPAVEPSDPEVGESQVVVGPDAGTATSHPFWLEGFGIEDPEARLVVTSRSDEAVAGGSRALQADVGDVRATDGTQRRVIRRERVLQDGQVVFRFDEAGPAYSPDGRRLVHGRDLRVTGPDPDGRVLVVADADGSDAALLLPPGGREPSDVDLDPVWSPDGARVAFVRLTGRDGGGGPAPPEVYVHDLRTGTVTRIPGPAGDDVATLSPSWAPDSRHLVVARTTTLGGSLSDAARRWRAAPRTGGPHLAVVDADRPLEPAYVPDTCGDGCLVRGRSPAWSPDGTTIAYERDGELRTVGLAGPCCAAPVVAAGPDVLVGFDPLTDEATPSRAVVESAQDPAWSPDGTEIAFTGQPVGQPERRGIWRIGADGADVRVFTDEPGPESEPAWQDRRDTDVGVTVVVAGSPALVGEPIVASFTVTNHGPRPAPLTSLTTTFSAGALTAASPGAPAGCRADGTGCDLGLLAPGDSRVYRVRVRHPAKVLGTATGTVATDAPDPVPANDVASAPYRTMGADVAVRIRLDRPVGYVGGTRSAVVTVRNAEVDPVEDVAVRATWTTALTPSVPPPLPLPAAPPAPACLVAGASCPLGTLAPGARRRFRVELATTTEGVVVVSAEVTTSTPEVELANNADEAQVDVLQPTLRLLPSVAPPGKVVLAYGEDMPPLSQVTLTWVRGITNHVGPFRVSADGTLRMPVLVIRHDLMGERELEAASRTDLFSPVRGVLLVVPRTLAPPSFNGRG